MERYIDQFDVVDMLKQRTGFYKYQIKQVLDALEDIIYENMQEATLEERSECRLFFGFVIGAKRVPAKKKRHPLTQEEVDIKEHLNPYATFKKTFQKKVNEYWKEDDDADDEYAEYMDEDA